MTQTRGTSRAFTLLEAMVVVIVVGVLAVSAIPAANVMTGMNRAGATAEIVRGLELARARAMSTGRPHGVQFSVTSQSMSPVWLASAGAAPTPTKSQLGTDEPSVQFATFGGAKLKTYQGGDGVSTAGVIWFAADGTPQSRSSGGALLGSWNADATLQVEGDSIVTVRRITGLIE